MTNQFQMTYSFYDVNGNLMGWHIVSDPPPPIWRLPEQSPIHVYSALKESDALKAPTFRIQHFERRRLLDGTLFYMEIS